MSGGEIEGAILDDGTVVEEAFGDGRQQLGIGKSWSSLVNPGRAGSLRDEDEGVIVVNELAIEIDGKAIAEADLGGRAKGEGGFGLELEGE